MATCPECDFDDIDSDDYEEGDTLSCPECGTTLKMGPDGLETADDDDDDLDDDDLEDEEDEEEDLDEDEDDGDEEELDE
jgi:hypothetical protein